jgi:hypothetical protein
VLANVEQTRTLDTGDTVRGIPRLAPQPADVNKMHKIESTCYASTKVQLCHSALGLSYQYPLNVSPSFPFILLAKFT